jgi:hypothetical protein
MSSKEYTGSPLGVESDSVSLLSNILRAIQALIGEVRKLAGPAGTPKTWSTKGTVTAPSAAAVLARVAGTDPKRIYGYLVCAGEANTIQITYTTGKGSRVIQIPFGSAGHLLVVSEIEPLTPEITSEIVMSVVNAGGTGIDYQGSILYG